MSELYRNKRSHCSAGMLIQRDRKDIYRDTEALAKIPTTGVAPSTLSRRDGLSRLTVFGTYKF